MQIVSIGPHRLTDFGGDLGKLIQAARADGVKSWNMRVARAGSPKIYKETAFFYKLKTLLRAAGLDAIKRNPQSDGHMLSAPYYIRERKWEWAIEDGGSALRLVHEFYNRYDDVCLTFHNWEKA